MLETVALVGQYEISYAKNFTAEYAEERREDNSIPMAETTAEATTSLRVCDEMIS